MTSAKDGGVGQGWRCGCGGSSKCPVCGSSKLDRCDKDDG
jgi:hypothetical protein